MFQLSGVYREVLDDPSVKKHKAWLQSIGFIEKSIKGLIDKYVRMIRKQGLNYLESP